MAIHNFRKLTIWKEAMLIAKSVYSVTANLPKDEKYGLISQMNRCSISITSNIAEGSGRGTNKDFNRFLDISLGSSYELETQLILAGEIFELKKDEVIPRLIDLQKMIIGFKRSLN